MGSCKGGNGLENRRRQRSGRFHTGPAAAEIMHPLTRHRDPQPADDLAAMPNSTIHLALPASQSKCNLALLTFMGWSGDHWPLGVEAQFPMNDNRFRTLEGLFFENPGRNARRAANRKTQGCATEKWSFCRSPRCRFRRGLGRMLQPRPCPCPSILSPPYQPHCPLGMNPQRSRAHVTGSGTSTPTASILLDGLREVSHNACTERILRIRDSRQSGSRSISFAWQRG